MSSHDGLAEIAEEINKVSGQFPEIRAVVVGNGGWRFLNEHFLSERIYPEIELSAEQVVYIGRTGKLFLGLDQAIHEQSEERFAIGGEHCADDIDRLSEYKNDFENSRTEISRFLRPADLVVLVASLDNGMSFVAGKEVSQMCQEMDIPVIGLVATPYSSDAGSAVIAGQVATNTEAVVDQLIRNRQSVILDEGFWGGAPGLPIEWSWHYQDAAVGLISQAIKSENFIQFCKMAAASTRMSCGYGIGDSAAEAIQQVIDADSGWGALAHGREMTAGGAVILIHAHPEMIEQLRTELLRQLQRPGQFKRKGREYWRRGAQFIVVANPDKSLSKDLTYSLDILSTGVEITKSQIFWEQDYAI